MKPSRKGDVCDCDHWRGITILIIARKILCQVLLKRFQKKINAKLREEQAGLRYGRSWNEQIFALNTKITEQS